MGNSNSASLYGTDATKDEVINLYRKYVTGHTVSGGSELGLGDLKNYGSSAMSHAKQQLIRDIAADMSHKLKINKLNPANKSIAEIVRELKEVIPNPRSNGKTWSPKDASQMAACKTMAEIINNRMKDVVVDTSAKSGDICEQVAEIMYSLFTGMQAEFIGVKVQVEHAMKNVQLCMDLLEAQHKQIQHGLNSHDSADDIKRSVHNTQLAHEDVMHELNHQMKVLQGLLDVVITPTNKELLHAFRDLTDIKDLGKKIRQFPGTANFGSKVAYALSSFTSAANAAKLVDDALKSIGVKLKEYESAKTSKEMRQLTSDALLKILPHATATQLKDYEAVVKLLNETMYMHGDLVAELKKLGVSGAFEEGLANIAGADEISGGDDTTGPVSGGAKVDKRLKHKKLIRETLVKEFGGRLSQYLTGILLSAQSLSKQIGSGTLPLTDSLEKIPRALETLPEYQTSAFYALSGFHNDIRSRQDRESYISILKNIIAILDAAIKESANVGQFKDMRRGFTEIIQLIELFASRFKDEHGTVGAGTDSNALAATGADEMSGGAEMTHVAFQFATLKDTVSYAFRTARIRLNMAKVAKENAESAKDYEKVSADAIAGAVDSLMRQKIALQTAQADPSIAGNSLKSLYDALVNSPPAPLPVGCTTVAEAAKKLTCDITAPIVEGFDTRISMLRTAEAVDRYLMCFADGIVKDVDAMSSIMNILNNTEVISQWYTAKSGEKLCQVFDSFPSSVDNNGMASQSHLNDQLGAQYSKTHYFLKVAALCRLSDINDVRTHNAAFTGAHADWAAWTTAAGLNNNADPIANAQPANPDTPGPPGLPGIPLLGLTYKEAPKITDLATKFLSVSMLKNIISVFITVGSKFGGEDVAREAKFNAALVYRELNKYIAQSAFTYQVANPLNTDNQSDIDFGEMRDQSMFMGGSYVADTRYPINRIALHIGRLDQGTPQEIITRWSAFAMRSVDTGSKAPYADVYAGQTDSLFKMIIKSIVAKVLTAVGVFNMFQRPVQESALGYNNVLRQVLGGDDRAKVIPEALELYIRLPLLAEFYRKVLPFDGQTERITMVPEIEGIFADLITVVFDDASSVEVGSYSTSLMTALIDSINRIWLAYKDKKNPINDAIQDFVAEVNRRIGIYDTKEQQLWLDSHNDRYNDSYRSENPDDITDFELSTIDESDMSTGAMQPSRQYETTWYEASKNLNSGIRDPKHKYNLNTNHQRYLNTIRQQIDKMFTEAQGRYSHDLDAINKRFTFAHIIEARTSELRHAQTDEDRLRIVTGAISSLGHFSSSALEKSYLLFHERVVAPLATLRATYELLKTFNTKLNDMYLAVFKVRKWAAGNKTLTDHNAMNQIGEGLLDANETYRIIDKYFHNYDVAGRVNNNTIDNIVVRGTYQGCDYVGNNVDRINAGITYGNLINNKAVYQTGDGRKFVERFVLDQDKLVKQLIELLYDHTATLDDYVKLRIDSNQDLAKGSVGVQVMLDHSGIRNAVFALFDDIKKSMDKFRGLLPRDVIAPYEQYVENDASSLYSLERSLIDGLFGGKHIKHGGVFTYDADLPKDDSIEKAGEKVKYLLEFLSTAWKFNARGVTNVNGLPADHAALKRLNNMGQVGVDAPETANGGGVGHEFADTLSELITYKIGRTAATDYAVNAVVATPLSTNIDKILFNTSSKAVGVTNASAPWTPNSTDTHGLMLDYSHGFTGGAFRSVFAEFNQLVWAYISQMYDGSANKIYINCIQEFVSSEFSAAIFGNSTYNNSQFWMTNNILGSKAGEANGLLYSQTALIIRQIMNEKIIGTDNKRFLELSLTEVPLYIKEKMRAQLPIFVKLFKYLIKRSELLKNFVHILNVEQPVNKGNAFAGANFPANLVYAAASNKSRSENENIMMSVLDRVIQGCSVLATCAQNVYKELADSPKYLETHHGFINEFESLNAKSPFMPPSTMLFWLKNSNVPYDLKNTIIEDESPLPFFQMGSTSFKLEYGTRGILGQAKSTYSDAPGYVRIIKEHNGSTDSRYHFSESGDDGGLAAWNGYIGLIRYMLDARVYRSGLFGSVNRSLRDNSAAIAADNNCRSGYAALANIVTERQIGRPSTAPYAWLSGLKLHALIRMTESSSIRESKSKIVSIVEKTGVNTMGGDRTDMMIYNIIDLNIVPINFNALRREIPLIHLYNYSYTFDKFISEILNVKDADVNFDAATPIGKYWAMPDAGRTSNDGKIMLARLLINPYLPITFDDYDTRIAKIMRGNLGIDGLDRPKFLSDVLYNGPLFGEIYADHLDYEEGGPAVGDGSLHGRQALIYGMPAGNNSYIKLAVENVWAVVRVVFNNAPVVQNTVAALKKAIEAYATDVYENDGTRKPINVDTAAATLLTTLNNLYTPVLTDTMTYAIAALFAIFTESKDIRNLLLPALRAVGNDINTAVQRSNVQGHLFNMFVPAYNHVAVNGNHLDGGSSFVRKIGVRLNNLGLANLAALQANNTILITVLAINNNAIVDNYVNNTVAIIKAMTTSGNTYSQAGRNLAEDDSRRFYSPNLHYIDVDDNGDGQIKTVPMSASNKQMLQHIGKVRFDTCLFRNIFWLANIQRIIRLCMNRSLHWYDEKIVHKHATTNADITELFGNRVNLSPPRP